MTAGSLFETLRKDLPYLCKATDLVRVGLYRNVQAVYLARKLGEGPPFMVIPHRGVVYPREGIIEFLESHIEMQADISNT